MRQESFAPSHQNGVRTRLTDPSTIATAAKLMREAGYTELAIWRHFIDAFAVDLDALSLIMAELFGSSRGDDAQRWPATERRAKPHQLRAA
ncbi:MAG: hypothetical protein JO357_11625 [Hyphomicrobiales bacterium]|nr:hypothetical protein [Hyphomicrobiales bacterium]MBV9137696.1 hypothetical protein [Hyphomicrobiales bacterium]MBV9752416.1 hypothetical protein [Hyphomicrobiales bacterium]